ncbi:hypothetical protein EYF80_049551 [Liparis tanakae]|uniref:Uncharacterized protein n=1 Tax=Liparis tanakae TaxID=230148 RepID=A0A4Z2FHN7_9TELE|nr:hypothetical protein EYF80_049551 [Liparis tanakae]
MARDAAVRLTEDYSSRGDNAIVRNQRAIGGNTARCATRARPTLTDRSRPAFRHSRRKRVANGKSQVANVGPAELVIAVSIPWSAIYSQHGSDALWLRASVITGLSRRDCGARDDKMKTRSKILVKRRPGVVKPLALEPYKALPASSLTADRGSLPRQRQRASFSLGRCSPQQHVTLSLRVA